MAIRDPVVVYNAANNIEALTICEMLQNAGIDAHAVEDVSQAGAWMFGLLPQVHRPQVYVGRDDVLSAKPLLEEYSERRDAKSRAGGDELEVEATCEECGEGAFYPASRLGFVETCPHCGAYVDVGEEDGGERWE
jgi:hypothetical protein